MRSAFLPGEPSAFSLRAPALLAAMSLLLCALLAGCLGSDPSTRRAGPAPVVRQQRFAVTRPSLRKVAIAPFVPALESSYTSPLTERSSRETADLVTRYFSEALAGQGIEVVSPSDVRLALRAGSVESPNETVGAAAQVAARKFAATGLIVGRVSRYRDREGGGLATAEPASVGFEVELYAVPDGKRLWTGRFSHTQQSLDYKPLEAARYPGRGTRWLSAAELARWGAQQTARSLVTGP